MFHRVFALGYWVAGGLRLCRGYPDINDGKGKFVLLEEIKYLDIFFSTSYVFRRELINYAISGIIRIFVFENTRA